MPESQDREWSAPERTDANISDTSAPSSAEVPSGLQNLTLPQLIDLALRVNQRTRATWLQSQVAAASMRSALGDYLPKIEGGVEIEKNSQAFRTSRVSTDEDTAQADPTATTVGPYASLSFLLFDFGRREAEVDAFRNALIAANFAHNAEIQDVIYEVQRSFYSYISLRALAAAQDESIAEAEENVRSAEARSQVGVATRADVLQARTALSQALLERQDTEGQIQVLRGLVATAVGVAPSASFDVAPIDVFALPEIALTQSAEALMAQAQRTSPDLRALEAQAAQAQSLYRAEARRRFPSIGAAGTYENLERGSVSDDGYTTALRLSVPIFTGFSLTNEIRRAELQAELAQSRVTSARQQLALDMWSGYFTMKRALQQIETARALLASASESLEVAQGRYREGVGTILDIVSAQASLSQARASAVKAKTDLLLSLLQLQRSAGVFAPETLRSPS